MKVCTGKDGRRKKAMFEEARYHRDKKKKLTKLNICNEKNRSGEKWRGLNLGKGLAYKRIIEEPFHFFTFPFSFTFYFSQQLNNGPY
jgi:hypothetical protein